MYELDNRPGYAIEHYPKNGEGAIRSVGHGGEPGGVRVGEVQNPGTASKCVCGLRCYATQVVMSVVHRDEANEKWTKGQMCRFDSCGWCGRAAQWECDIDRQLCCGSSYAISVEVRTSVPSMQAHTHAPRCRSPAIRSMASARPAVRLLQVGGAMIDAGRSPSATCDKLDQKFWMEAEPRSPALRRKQQRRSARVLPWATSRRDRPRAARTRQT